MDESSSADGPSEAPQNRQQKLAPRYEVPKEQLVNIEHPCIVKNEDKGIRSLGGSKQIEKLLTSNPGERNILVTPRSDDILAQCITSRPVRTDSILFKVSVPKRTGRKRRRGSNGPWIQDPSISTTTPPRAEDILSRLQDNPDKYKIEAIGSVNETHRFRSMPDCVNTTSDVPITEKFKSQLLSEKFTMKMKDFSFDPAKGASLDIYIPPPKSFTYNPHPYNYNYRQNPASRPVRNGETGETYMVNIAKTQKVALLPLAYNAQSDTTKPPPALAPISTLTEDMKLGITKLNELLEIRPIITRRVAINYMGGRFEHDYKTITQYCGYGFRSGPWRDTLVRYGIDPRTDPKYRKYQTLMFQLSAGATFPTMEQGNGSAQRTPGRVRKRIDVTEAQWTHSTAPRSKLSDDDRDSHIFDGSELKRDGKIWQVCDIKEPILKELLDTPIIRKECHLENDGWYPNGIWGKVKFLMRDMLTVLEKNEQEDAEHRGPSKEDKEVWKAAALVIPDIVGHDPFETVWVGEGKDKDKKKRNRVEHLAALVRPWAKRSVGETMHVSEWNSASRLGHGEDIGAAATNEQLGIHDRHKGRMVDDDTTKTHPKDGVDVEDMDIGVDEEDEDEDETDMIIDALMEEEDDDEEEEEL
ncbi:MAG: tau 95 subunit of transcription factor TFIIIC [Bogoriella megaspora]|nr:MAG: tau 95 subunit of transcription factor TFIIIC [Bogoriella megaspora]